MGVLLLIVLASVAGFAGYRVATRTRTHVIRVVFRTMPPDDTALLDWVRKQPGVREANASRDGDALTVVIVMPGSSKDPEPAVVPQAEKLGYGGWGGLKDTVTFSPIRPW